MNDALAARSEMQILEEAFRRIVDVAGKRRDPAQRGNGDGMV